MIGQEERQRLLAQAISEARLRERGSPPARPPFVFRVAGVRVCWRSRDAELAARIEAYFSGYRDLGDARADGTDLTIFAEPRGFSETDPWECEDPEFHPVPGALGRDSVIQRDFFAQRERDPRGGALGHEVWAVLAPGLDDAVHNLLRWALPPLLLERRAFLLHAAGVVREGRGYVFFGQSGAGKSTSAELIARADRAALVVGDDSVILRWAERPSSAGTGELYLHSAPLGCGYSSDAPPPAAVPVAGVFALEQSERVQIVPLGRAAGAAGLLASAMSFMSLTTPAAPGLEGDLERKLDLALAMAGAPGGVRRLRFRRDPAFWEKILEVSHESQEVCHE